MFFLSFWKWKKISPYTFLYRKSKQKSHAWHTFGDHALKVDDVRVVELAHDAGLRQEVPPLLVGVAGLQRLDGHADLPLARHLQAAAADLAELPWKHTACCENVKRWHTSALILQCPAYKSHQEGTRWWCVPLCVFVCVQVRRGPL